MAHLCKIVLATALLGVTGAAAAESDARAQAQAFSVCLPHDEAVAKLGEQFGERQVGLGLAGRGESVVELFVAETGSWTVLVTRTDGTSCVAAAGDSWIADPEAAGDPV